MSYLIKINFKKTASGKLPYRHRELNPVLCDNLGVGRGWRVEVQEAGDMCIFWPIHIAVGRNQHNVVKQLSSN